MSNKLWPMLAAKQGWKMAWQWLQRLFGQKKTVGTDSAGAFEVLEALAPRVDTPEPALGGAKETLICRDAILDRAQRVAGYQFMLRASIVSRVKGGTKSIRRLYDQVVLNRLAGSEISRLLGKRFALVELASPDVLLDPLVDQLPLCQIIFVLNLDGLEIGAEYLERLQSLKDRGLRLGVLSEQPFNAEFDDLMALADLYVMDVAAGESTLVLLNRIFSSWPHIRVLVRGIDSYDTFEVCHAQQHQLYFIQYFQGPFITRRENWTQFKAEAGRLSILQVINQLRRGAELPEIAKVLRQDSVLTFRLLRHVNSPAGGLATPVNRIEHAVVVLGRERLARWLSILLFNAAESSPREMALLDTALIRGRLAETLSEGRVARMDQENLFLTGLFSLLDCLLRAPMKDILDQLQLPEPLREALMTGTGPYAPWLELVVACETGQGDLEQLAHACGLSESEVNIRQMEAILWAQELQQ